MSVKSEKLVKSIQEIQQFLANRTEQHDAFETIAQLLEKSVASLKEGKLTLQIVGQDPRSAKALHDLLRTHELLSASYQFKITPLTHDLQLAQLESTAALTLQASNPQNCCEQRHELSTTDKLAIGRHPECQILVPDHYLLVSGYHASIQSCADSDFDQTGLDWQICDLSRNGTYVNEQRVQGCQVLMEGDRITLGSPTATETSPELIFESQPVLGTRDKQGDTSLTDCDVLCLITNSNSALTVAEQQLIEQIRIAKSANFPANFLIVAETPLTHPAIQDVKSNTSNVNDWLQHHGSSAEVFLLSLHDHGKTQTTQIDPTFQRELDKFCKALESPVKRKPEDILAKRLTVQVLAQLNLIEQFLDIREKKLARESQRDEARLKEPGPSQSKEKVDYIAKRICDDRGAFFKQAKDKLKQSKVDLLDDYLENSISYKIRRFVDQLKPHVIKQQGRKYIQLRFSTIKVVEPKGTKRKLLKPEAVEEKTVDANTALMNFCRSELSWWADEEWETFYMTYPQNGLIGLFQKIYESLHSIAAIDLNDLLFQPEQSIDHQAVFAEAFAMPVSESRYQEASPVMYILKKIRSQWMQFIFIFSFLSVLGIAGRRQIMQRFMAPIVNAFKASPYISAVVLIVILYFLFRFLIRLYREDRDLEREKEAEKIRNNLRSYYQALAKNRLVEKIVQNLNVALETEEQRVEKILQIARQQTDRIATETERKQDPIKKRILKREVLRKELRGDRDRLQKLKRVLDVKSF